MKRNLKPPMKRALRLKNLFLTVCFLLIGTAAFSQERTITGVVTDSFKEPLIGVSIVVQGTNTGVVTGLDGDYSIQVPPNATLDFSYVGMEKQSIKVGNQSVINVQMKEDSQMLAETVVIGYKVKWPVYKSSTPVRQVPTRKSAYAVQTLSMVTSPCM